MYNDERERLITMTVLLECMYLPLRQRQSDPECT